MHVTLPKTVKHICFDGQCRRSLCPISVALGSIEDLTSMHFAPSNNEILFDLGPNASNCEFNKPAGWDSWVKHYFGNVDPEIWDERSLMLEDWDKDGVSNIIEYYGLDLTRVYEGLPLKNTNNATEEATGRNLVSTANVPSTSTDPTTSDSDGDLLTDFFELLYGMDPLVVNSLVVDSDGGGLIDFQEHIYHTCPLAVDTDLDGLSDYEEVMAGSNPCNDRIARNDSATVDVTLTIGDPSGSHSERYTMIFDPIEHAADQFGVLSTGTYVDPVGIYEVVIAHRGSKYSTPYYDYMATIEFEGETEGFNITIIDPNGILGLHRESFFNYAKGKTAHVIIEQELSAACSSQERSLLVQKKGITPVKGKIQSDLMFTPERRVQSICCERIKMCQSCNSVSSCEWKGEGGLAGAARKYSLFLECPSSQKMA